ncbi:unnamed protein product [Kluyveromyces dobzhanskii CBS 2104]|uniref:Pre-mRNA-splicing factor SYF1 n=1 Tax=Kluyveromyces dobzhanskii CBS 2104 TaxID=1427455 RepID=A0A0A8L6E1_9SACH|nr:unnamed protein product [Kluyveromyces dobzhanskii CBS 2104]
MDWKRFVKEEDVPFEYSVVRDGKNAVPWSRYIATKRSSGNELNLDWLYERCLVEIKDDWNLWKEFLKWRIELLDECNIIEYASEYDKVTTLLEQCLNSCGSVRDAWIMYLRWVIKLKDLQKIRIVLGRALRSLNWEFHESLWDVVVDFTVNELLVDSVDFTLTLEEAIYSFINGEKSSSADPDIWSSSILERYSLICENPESLLINIYKTCDWNVVAKVYRRHLSQNLQPSQTSLFELYSKYLTVLVLINDTNTLSNTVQQCIDMFPSKKGELQTYSILSLIHQDKISEAENYLDLHIKETKDVKEFSVLYDFWIRLEELLTLEYIQQMKRSGSENLESILTIRHHADTLNSIIADHTIRLNDLELRKEPNNIRLWLDRVKLFPSVSEKAKVYADAVLTVDHKVQTSPGILGDLWCQYCKLFEGDRTRCEVLLDKATNVPFKFLIDLEKIWLYWSEYRLKKSVNEAIVVLSTVLEVPDNYELLLQKFDKGEAPAQASIFSSKRLWTMYLDLLEATGDHDKVSTAYETAISIKAATPAMFINYAIFNESCGRTFEALAVLERCVEIFPPYASKPIWEIYIDMALRADISVEQKREIFDSAIKLAESGIPCVSFFEKYSHFESNLGLPERSVEVLHKGVNAISDVEGKCTLWKECINESEKKLDIDVTRKLYEECIETLPNSKAVKFIIPFAILEESRNEIARCRSLLEYGSKLLKPVQNEELWDFWKNFEIMHGTKDTFKDMLRTQRFLTDTMKIDTEEVSKMGSNIEFKASTATAGGQTSSNKDGNAKSNTDEIDIGL